MSLRNVRQLLVNHGCTAASGLVESDPAVHVAATRSIESANETPTGPCADLERRSLLARLVYRGKRDPIICRAARRLQADPPSSLEQLAAELSVSEGYLSRGLQAVLGQSPARLFR